MIQEFTQEIENTVKNLLNDVHIAMPGIVKEFDTKTCLARVQPTAQYKLPDGRTIAFPVLTSVPVVLIQAGGAAIAYPIKSGDGCLLIVCEQALDHWLYGGETDTDLKFDLTNAIAIPGLSNAPQKAMTEAAANNALIMQSAASKISITPGEIKAEIGGTNLTVSGSSVTVKGEFNLNGDLNLQGGATINGNINLNGSMLYTGEITKR